VEALARDGELFAYPHGGFWQAMDTLRDKPILKTFGRKVRRLGRLVILLPIFGAADRF